MSSLAVLADIHGNSLALDAVLADIDRRGITRIVNLGDAVYGSLDAAGTVDRLRSRGIVSISGNGDRLFGDPPTAPDVQAAVAAMGPERLRWLTGLPATLVLDGIFLCHGTPADDTVYLLERVTAERGLEARPLADVA
jgi:predicted phosphodiesterase